ncbi:MAG TPA: hypothetical protein VLA54_02190 [Acidimicrobiia bacterium]|nr:hypothetical protein [Acidimicrobiia bacterium]
MALEPEPITPAVDFALLADAVQAVQGKLFILGGGWDTLYVSSFPARHPAMAIALRVKVPWSSSSQQIKIGVELQDADGASLLPGGQVVHTVAVPRRNEMERADTGLVRSFTLANLTFEKAGDYSFVISVDDQVAERLRFMVRTKR